MENNIQITIGFPVYNVEKYVEKSLRSALDQDFVMQYEILVIDDCGTDLSMAIIDELCKSHPRGNIVRIIHHGINKGLGEARNTVIKNAKGKYLFFLDSDDWMYSECLSKLYYVAESNKSDIICGSAEKENETDGERSVYFRYKDAVYKHDSAGAWMISKNIFIATTAWNKLYNLDFIRKNNIHIIHKKYEDQWFSYNTWLYACNIATLSDFTLCYNVRRGSIMTSIYGKKCSDDNVYICCDIIKKVGELIEEKFSNTKGVYDLYYKVIKANIDILISTLYTEQQKEYMEENLYHIARKVPGVFSLRVNKNRFIYICSRIYENIFTFYRYEKWYNAIFYK